MKKYLEIWNNYGILRHFLTWESIQTDHQPTNKFNTNDETTEDIQQHHQS